MVKVRSEQEVKSARVGGGALWAEWGNGLTPQGMSWEMEVTWEMGGCGF